VGAIYLIRHGQASFGKADYDELSPLGLEQAGILGTALRARLPRIDAVYSGSMRRHRQTADACLAGMQRAAPRHEDTGFNEYDHEEMLQRLRPDLADPAQMNAHLAQEKDPRRAFQAIFAAAMERWMSGGHDGDYRESWPAFRARCVGALERVRSECGAAGTVLVFTSGGPITAICQHLLDVPSAHVARINWTMANCGVSKLICSERSIYLSTLNEHAHFEGERSRYISYR
jgi:broad specificity phosphatase PhoE